MVNRFALEIGRSGDLTSRIHLSSRDEIASLADSFNQMVAQLHQARVDLMERSYRAGIAELASGILHNVRNSLTSLRVEIESLNQQIQDLPLQHIRQARQELDNPDLPPQRRKELEHFMFMAGQTITEAIDRLADGFQKYHQSHRPDRAKPDAARPTQPQRQYDRAIQNYRNPA
jgi:HAMP domain.